MTLTPAEKKDKTHRSVLLLLAAALAAALALALISTRETLRGLPQGAPRRHPELEFDPVALMRENPLPDSPEVRALGRKLFGEACAECHGRTGRGDGPSATRQDPRPADLHTSGVVQGHSDAWLFLRISRGKLDTAMPPFSPTHSARERWAVVRFLRILVR